MTQPGDDVVAFITWGKHLGPFIGIGRSLAKGFRELNARFDLVLLSNPASVSSDGGIREVRLGEHRARNSTLVLARYLRQASPTIALVAPSHLAPFALLAGKTTGSDVVPWEGTFPSWDMPDLPKRMRLFHVLQRVSYRWAPMIAVVSRDVGRHLLGELRGAIGDSQIRTIPNPVDMDHVRELAAAPATLGSDGFRFVAAGRLVRHKGFDVLLQALALAQTRLPQSWELLVLGDGPRREELENLTLGLGLESVVKWLGTVENPYPVMKSADVFVHPARYEGFGVVLLEALSLSLPVLATECPGGPKEILREGEFGLLARPEDPQDLANQLVRIGADSELRRTLREKAERRARDFAPAAVAQSLISLAEIVRSS